MINRKITKKIQEGRFNNNKKKYKLKKLQQKFL